MIDQNELSLELGQMQAVTKAAISAFDGREHDDLGHLLDLLERSLKTMKRRVDRLDDSLN